MNRADHVRYSELRDGLGKFAELAERVRKLEMSAESWDRADGDLAARIVGGDSDGQPSKFLTDVSISPFLMRQLIRDDLSRYETEKSSLMVRLDAALAAFRSQ